MWLGGGGACVGTMLAPFHAVAAGQSQGHMTRLQVSERMFI